MYRTPVTWQKQLKVIHLLLSSRADVDIVFALCRKNQHCSSFNWEEQTFLSNLSIQMKKYINLSFSKNSLRQFEIDNSLDHI